MEIRSALEAGHPVLPVLVNDAAIPPHDDLPDEIREVARLSAVRLHLQRWNEGVEDVLKALEQAGVTPGEALVFISHASADRTGPRRSPGAWRPAAIDAGSPRGTCPPAAPMPVSFRRQFSPAVPWS